MAFPLIAQIGIGIVSSIIQYAALKNSTSPTETKAAPQEAANNTPASTVSLSNKLASIGDSQSATAAASTATQKKSSIETFVAKAPDAVKKAWDKTKQDLSLDGKAGNYYMNEMAAMAIMAEANAKSGVQGTEGTKGTPAVQGADKVNPFGFSKASAVSALDAMIDRLQNNALTGYGQNAQDKQAALEMYSIFKQNLMNA